MGGLTFQELDDLREWLREQIDASMADKSGTNDYHNGLESAYDSVLDYLERRK